MARRCLLLGLCWLAITTSGWAQSVDSFSTATGISRAFNPAISVNALFLTYYYSSDEARHGRFHHHIHQHDGDGEAEEGIPGNGIDLQEMEVQFGAVVDPFFQATLTLAYAEAHGFQMEEGYLLLLTLPRGLGGRVGRFLMPFGKHNQLHTHQFPFTDPPLVSKRLFGAHGYIDTGLELGYLLPLGWFSELTIAAADGRGDGLFEETRDGPSGLLRWRNLWDLGESTTLEIGGSMLRGPAAHVAGIRAPFDSYLGADLTVKWVPVRRSQHRAIVWQTEVMGSRRASDEETRGFYSLMQWRFRRRWWVQGGYSLVRDHRLGGDSPGSADEWIDRETKVGVVFVPSEFSALKLELAVADPEEGDREIAGLFQVNFTIGSHPAHKY